MIILCLFFVPIIILLIWQYRNPKEAILSGRRWLYKNEPEVSEAAVQYVKYASIYGILFIMTIFLITPLDYQIISIVEAYFLVKRD